MKIVGYDTSSGKWIIQCDCGAEFKFCTLNKPHSQPKCGSCGKVELLRELVEKHLRR